MAPCNFTELVVINSCHLLCVPAGVGRLDWMTCRGPFQPQPFCNKSPYIFVEVSTDGCVVSALDTEEQPVGLR